MVAMLATQFYEKYTDMQNKPATSPAQAFHLPLFCRLHDFSLANTRQEILSSNCLVPTALLENYEVSSRFRATPAS